jgi:hypothetical protein
MKIAPDISVRLCEEVDTENAIRCARQPIPKPPSFHAQRANLDRWGSLLQTTYPGKPFHSRTMKLTASLSEHRSGIGVELFA